MFLERLSAFAYLFRCEAEMFFTESRKISLGRKSVYSCKFGKRDIGIMQVVFYVLPSAAVEPHVCIFIEESLEPAVERGYAAIGFARELGGRTDRFVVLENEFPEIGIFAQYGIKECRKLFFRVVSPEEKHEFFFFPGIEMIAVKTVRKTLFEKIGKLGYAVVHLQFVEIVPGIGHVPHQQIGGETMAKRRMSIHIAGNKLGMCVGEHMHLHFRRRKHYIAIFQYPAFIKPFGYRSRTFDRKDKHRNRPGQYARFAFFQFIIPETFLIGIRKVIYAGSMFVLIV